MHDMAMTSLQHNNDFTCLPPCGCSISPSHGLVPGIIEFLVTVKAAPEECVTRTGLL